MVGALRWVEVVLVSVHHHNEILRLLGSCGYWRRWWEFSGGYRKVPGGNERAWRRASYSSEVLMKANT